MENLHAEIKKEGKREHGWLNSYASKKVVGGIMQISEEGWFDHGTFRNSAI